MPNRMYVYHVGSLKANGVGSANVYSAHAITGRTYKIAVLTASAGSITITESGINEVILNKVV